MPNELLLANIGLGLKCCPAVPHLVSLLVRLQQHKLEC